MEVRREARQIWKHFERYHKTIGEAVIYYRFDADSSQYDTVYDEGYRRYHLGVRVPVLWVDQTESTEDYTSEGRRPTQRLRFAVSAREMYEAGFSVTEVHGNRLQDTSPSDIWRRDRMHDIVYYDGRYYELSAYQIRGRVQGEDVIIGITCIETFPSDDMIFDYQPGTVPIIIPPVGGFSIVTIAHATGYSFTFGTTAPAGNDVYWDFGDGQTNQAPAEQPIDHAYPPGDYIVTAAVQQQTDTTAVEASGSVVPVFTTSPFITLGVGTAHCDPGVYIGTPTPDINFVWWLKVPYGWEPQYNLYPAQDIDTTPYIGETLAVQVSVYNVVGQAAQMTPEVVVPVTVGYGSGPYGSGPYGGT